MFLVPAESYILCYIRRTCSLWGTTILTLVFCGIL